MTDIFPFCTLHSKSFDINILGLDINLNFKVKIPHTFENKTLSLQEYPSFEYKHIT